MWPKQVETWSTGDEVFAYVDTQDHSTSSEGAWTLVDQGLGTPV